MYQFSPSTERINHMRELIRDRVIRNDAERMRIITESYRKNEYMPPLIKRSLAFKDLCEQMTVFIKDGELVLFGDTKRIESEQGADIVEMYRRIYGEEAPVHG